MSGKGCWIFIFLMAVLVHGCSTLETNAFCDLSEWITCSAEKKLNAQATLQLVMRPQ